MEMPSTLEAAHLVRRGHVSAAELLGICLEAIEDRNGELNAFVHLDAERALGAGRRRRPRSWRRARPMRSGRWPACRSA